jgi:hypothetical protein
MIQKVDSGCADFAPEKEELSTTQENGDAPPLHPNPRRARALEAYYDLGTVIAACKRVGISRRTWYNWAEADPVFADAVRRATEHVADDLEAEAIRRAKDGSDTLLIFLLKAKRPAVYRERHTINVVSPEVQSRLFRQTDAIMQTCRELLGTDEATAFTHSLAVKLQEVWCS